MQLQGKTVLITGGSSGIGDALAKALVQKGATVYSFDKVTPDPPPEGVTYVQADVTDSKQISQALAKVSKPIDVLVSNAGIMRRGTVLETTEEDFDLLFATNVKGAWLVLKNAKPLLAPNATIVVMSSGLALKPQADPGVYTLTKKTLLGLAEILELTYPEYRVKVVCPGPVNTPLLHHGRSEQDSERIAKIAHPPELIAEKVVELLETDKKRVLFDDPNWNYVLE